MIDFDTVRRASADLGVELRGGAADETPGVFTRLKEVLRDLEGPDRILHRLEPIGVAMAGADTFDPHKD
jgi:tRNA-splicing ligase RtcB (3'-phosphate/5'-hydroxy nucleic acid ligase)